MAPGGQIPNNRSMWVHLLPFVEQQALYTTFAGTGMTSTTSIVGPTNAAVISPYLAPSDAFANSSANALNFAGNIRIFGNKALGTSANNVGTTAPSFTTANTTVSNPPAVLCGLTLARIADGTTNTIMLATRYSNCGATAVPTYYFGDPYNSIPASGQGSGSAVAGGFFGLFQPASQPAKLATGSPMYQLQPALADCDNTASKYGHAFGVGGMSVALADSAVRNISATMGYQTFIYAICPGDGNPLPADWNDDA